MLKGGCLLGSGKTIQLGILALFIIGFIFSVSTAFAFWQDTTVTNTVDVIVVREGVELEVIDLNQQLSDKQLVPSGHQMFVGDVEVVTLSYNVGISRELINEVNLHIFAENITIGGANTYAHLVDINIMTQGDEAVVDLFNETITITLTVRLYEPIDENEANAKNLSLDVINVENGQVAYQAIAGQDIVFNLRFELSNKTQSNNEN